jgi:hypothetical protein
LPNLRKLIWSAEHNVHVPLVAIASGQLPRLKSLRFDVCSPENLSSAIDAIHRVSVEPIKLGITICQQFWFSDEALPRLETRSHTPRWKLKAYIVSDWPELVRFIQNVPQPGMPDSLSLYVAQDGRETTEDFWKRLGKAIRSNSNLRQLTLRDDAASLLPHLSRNCCIRTLTLISTEWLEQVRRAADFMPFLVRLKLREMPEGFWSVFASHESLREVVVAHDLEWKRELVHSSLWGPKGPSLCRLAARKIPVEWLPPFLSSDYSHQETEDAQ